MVPGRDRRRYPEPMAEIPPFLDRYYELLGAGDVDGFVGLYAPDAEIIRYDGVAEGLDAITAYVRDHLARHAGFRLRSIDALREADDVLMWDALVDTDNGIIQVVNVIVFDDEGRVHRHIPGLRGYWGK